MDYDLKCDKLSGFLCGAMRLGYSLDDAWSLLLSSRQGQGILNGEYLYCEHREGIVSAEDADRDLGKYYTKNEVVDPDVDSIDLLAEFIENTHLWFKIDYKDIFNKYSIGKFYKDFGYLLGDYDSKLVRAYLL